MTQKTYEPITGWLPFHYQRYDDGTASLLWRKTLNGQGMVWQIGVDGEKAGEMLYGPLTGWQAAAYIRTPQMPEVNAVTVWKAGTGTGIVTAGNWVCTTDCQVLRVPVIQGVVQSVQAMPDASSIFVGWQNANGELLAGLEYLKPGEAIFGLFNKK